ncbi:uncharacterized protein RHO17_020968 isoform 4-T4 [Thomomys bottae]
MVSGDTPTGREYPGSRSRLEGSAITECVCAEAHSAPTPQKGVCAFLLQQTFLWAQESSVEGRGKMSRMNQMSSHPGNDVRKRLLFIRGETDTLGFEKSPETTPPRIKSIITNKTKDCHKFPGTLGKKHNIHGVFLCLINHSHKK